ncbi:penicillin-binding protein 2 [Candidatus Fermentibacteria bacterium]|nr:penicillin-binding protein 2 [Candidatus Fermentibacteria bacterium]
MNRPIDHRSDVRARIMVIAGLLAWLVIQVRLVQIQVVKSEDLARDVVIDRVEYIPAQRGHICDRHGLPLAISTLAVEPQQDLMVRGPYRRSYPLGATAAPVVGLVGFSTPHGFTGREGIELQYEPLLRGTEGRVRYVITGAGRFCSFEPLKIDRLPIPGTSVYLTVDAVYQALAQIEAESLRVRHGATWTGILVMRPATGEILAAAASPCADPENFAPGLSTANLLWSRQFEPGSSFKVVTLAAALEGGLVAPETMIDCENGAWATPAKTWHDTSPLGIVPLRTAVAKSSNIAAAKLGIAVGSDAFVKLARDFGFGTKTSGHLHAEADGYLQNPGPHRRSSLAAMAMGQGLSVTGVQLLNAFCCIANGGRLMQPLLACGAEGIEPTVVRQVVSPTTARIMTELLRGAVEGGTGVEARHPCFSVAGKTGTAQVAGRGGVGYLPDSHIASFAGFFPVDSPQVAILVLVAEPRGEYYGGRVCAPVFKRMVDHMIAAPGGCLYPALAARLSLAPLNGWVSVSPDVDHG